MLKGLVIFSLLDLAFSYPELTLEDLLFTQLFPPLANLAWSVLELEDDLVCSLVQGFGEELGYFLAELESLRSSGPEDEA